MRFAIIIATTAIYFAATQAIPIPDEPSPPQSNPLIKNVGVPQLNLDGLFNGGAGGGGTGTEGAVGKFAVIARRKKRGEQPPPPGPAGSAVNTVTTGTGGLTAPVTEKTDPSLTNVAIIYAAAQGLIPVPGAEQAGLAPQVAGASGDAGSVAGAVDGLGVVSGGGGGAKKKQA